MCVLVFFDGFLGRGRLCEVLVLVLGNLKFFMVLVML